MREQGREETSDRRQVSDDSYLSRSGDGGDAQPEETTTEDVMPPDDDDASLGTTAGERRAASSVMFGPLRGSVPSPRADSAPNR